MSTFAHWVQASRPLAQANLAAPLLFGQALAYAQTGRFDLRMLGAVALWGILDQLFIVFANDYADRHDDGERTLFSGGSGVLVEGTIRPEAIRRAMVVSFVLLGALSGAMAMRAPLMLVAWIAAGVLIWAYSYAPLRLSYRGRGELLQALGVGAVLPLVGFTAQVGGVERFPWPVLLCTMMLGFAGNVSTALPDHGVDCKANKRTWAVRFGLARSAWAATGLSVAAIYLALATTPPIEMLGLLVLPVLALIPNLWVNTRRRASVLRLVFFQGLATQLLFLVWSVLLVRGDGF